MYTGRKENTNQVTLHTGPAVLQFLGVNLNNEQIKERCGYEPQQEVEYNKQEDQNGNTSQSVVFFFKDTNSNAIVRMNMSIGETPYKSSKGNYQVCTSDGSIVWAGKTEGETCVIKSEFEDHRPLVRGEADLITFVQRLVSFDTRSGENWMEQMTANNQAAANLFNKDYSGFEALYEYTTENNFTIIMPLEVREKDGKFYQQVCANSKTWFSGNRVNDWIVNRLKTLEEKENQNGRSLFKHMFTFTYQPFNKETAFGVVPDNPVVVDVAPW